MGSCNQIDAIADSGQNCPWTVLLFQLILAQFQSVPCAIPDSGSTGWKKPLQKQCLLSELFPLCLSITLAIFSSERGRKKLETIRLIIASNSLIWLKGECQRKSFLPKRLLQKRALATLPCLTGLSLAGHTMLIHGSMSTALSAHCLLTGTFRSAPEDSIKVSGCLWRPKLMAALPHVKIGSSRDEQKTSRHWQIYDDVHSSGWVRSCLPGGSANWGYMRQWQEHNSMSVKWWCVLMFQYLDKFPPHIMFPVCPSLVTALANPPNRLSHTLRGSCISQK